MVASAYPLTWPQTMPRHKAREKGSFRTTLAGALNNVSASLAAFGRDSGKALQDIVISSNVTLGVNRPADPGVAIWFTWDGLQVCIPVDRYQTVEANLQAIHHIVEARRVELRLGTLALVRATFTGFAALPSPAGKKPWREVLEIITSGPVAEENINRRLSQSRHPDRPGGSHDAMAELNRARDEGLREVAQ